MRRVSRRHDRASSQADADADRGEPDAAPFRTPGTSGTRPCLGLCGEQPGFVDEALPQIAPKVEPWAGGAQGISEPAQGRREREQLPFCAWVP